MSVPFKQIQLETIAPWPDDSVAEHLLPVTVQEPLVPGPDQLLVRVLLSPIHPCDLLCAAGLVPKRSGARDGADASQFLPGIEAVGRIEAVGDDLQADFQPGQRIFVCCWAPWGRWQEADGVWSEYLLVGKNNVIAVPEGISDSTAAMFLVIPVTAYIMMIEELQLKKGDWLIQNAAGSELGCWVIELARELGINTINLVRRQEQVEELKRRTGAEHVLWCPSDGSGEEELRQQIREVVGQEELRGALDAVGDGVFITMIFKVLARYGSVLVYGALGGTEMKISFESVCQVPLEGLSIRGYSLQNWWLPDTSDAEKKRVFDAVWSHILGNDRLNPRVAEVYPFDQVAKAVRASLEHKQGKVLLSPRPSDRNP